MLLAGVSSPAVSVIVAGITPGANVIVSVPEPGVQFEPDGVASLLAESMAWRRVHWVAVPAGSAAELTAMVAALAPAASDMKTPTAPIAAKDIPSFLPTPRICDS